MATEKEVWKEIPGYPDYQVSNLGRVKSFKFGKEKILKPRISKFGYFRVFLYKTENKGSISQLLSVHRLVASAFIPNHEQKPQINHKNGEKTDNRVGNLEWCTQSENQKHAFLIGLQRPIRGKNNPHAKLSEEDVKQILEMLRTKELSDQKIANCFSVSRKTIANIRTGKKWVHITRITNTKSDRPWRAKLTESDVLEIRNLLISKNFKQAEIAKRFKVSPQLISDIKNGRSWKHITRISDTQNIQPISAVC